MLAFSSRRGRPSVHPCVRSPSSLPSLRRGWRPPHRRPILKRAVPSFAFGLRRSNAQLTATNLAVARIGVDWRIFQIGGSGEKCHFATIWQRGASQGCETDHGCQRNRSVRQSVLGRRSGSRLIATYSPYSQASPSPRDLSPLSSSSSSTTTSENEPALRCVWCQMRSVGQKRQRKRLREMRV